MTNNIITNKESEEVHYEKKASSASCSRPIRDNSISKLRKER